MRLVIVAILIGLGGAYLLREYLKTPEAPVATPPANVNVPVASLDLPSNRVVKFGDIVILSVPHKEAEERGLLTTNTMSVSRQIIGRRLRVPVKQGRPFLTTELYPEGNAPNVTENLRQGYRAFRIALTSQQAGPVSIESKVDVSFRSTPRPAGNGMLAIPEKTVLLLSGAQVLDVENSSASTSVTLEVTPEQATMLQVVQGKGDVWLTVRRPGEIDSLTAASGSTLEEILEIKPPPVVVVEKEPEQPPPWYTVIYRRGSPSANAFSRNQLIEQQSLSPSDPMPGSGTTAPASIDGADTTVPKSSTDEKKAPG